MKFLLKSVLVFTLATLALNSLAQQQSITREIEVGALFTSGNTDEQALNFAGEYTITEDRWEYGFTLDALYAASNDETTGQRLYGVAGANYKFSEDSYFLARAAHQDDRFNGFDSQSDATFSYGRGFFRGRPDVSLRLDAGIGIRWSRLNGSDFDEPILRVAGQYEWILSETATFSQDLAVEYGTDSNIYRSDTGITTQINQNLSLRLSINLKHQTEVPAGRDETDIRTAATLVVAF